MPTSWSRRARRRAATARRSRRHGPRSCPWWGRWRWCRRSRMRSACRSWRPVASWTAAAWSRPWRSAPRGVQLGTRFLLASRERSAAELPAAAPRGRRDQHARSPTSTAAARRAASGTPSPGCSSPAAPARCRIPVRAPPPPTSTGPRSSATASGHTLSPARASASRSGNSPRPRSCGELMEEAQEVLERLPTR